AAFPALAVLSSSLANHGGQDVAALLANTWALPPQTMLAPSLGSPAPAALDHLFTGNAGGTGAALSGVNSGVRPQRTPTSWVDPLSGELAEELVASLVEVA